MITAPAPRYFRTPDAALHLGLSARTLKNIAAMERARSTANSAGVSYMPSRISTPGRILVVDRRHRTLARERCIPRVRCAADAERHLDAARSGPASGLRARAAVHADRPHPDRGTYRAVGSLWPHRRDQVTGPGRRSIFFRAGATCAVVRGTSSDFGTVHSSIAIVSAVAAGRPCACLPHVQPGGELLLRVDGRAKVQRVLAAIDAVEAAGLDACDVSPDHWRHVSDCVGAGTLFRPYGTERHAAWLRRRAIEA